MVDKRTVAPEEVALLEVTQRLARQLEQQLTQLRRMRDRASGPGDLVDAGLGELEHGARRMRRDAARLRLLCGADATEPGTPPGPRSVADLLADAAAASTEPVRLTVRPAPDAAVEPRAAAELGHVLVEVVDGALAESGLGVYIGGRLGPAGLTLDVTMDGPRRPPRRAPEQVAEALARRSVVGIQVHRGADGPYAIVLCPAPALTVPVQRRAAPVRAPATNEFGRAAPRTPGRAPAGRDMFGVRSRGSAGGGELFAEPDQGDRSDRYAGGVRPAGRSRAPAPPTPFDADPLFGPLPPGRVLDSAVSTPIYEAVASAWFREDGFLGPAAGDEAEGPTPGDLEWRAAAERAARAEDEGPSVTTASGLPRRRPGRQMVTPPLERAAAGRETRAAAQAQERVPDRVRHRLEDYQRGLRQGRHRAVEADPGA